MYNNLPYEIIELIKSYYWNFQFNNVINEINIQFKKIMKLNFF